MNLLRTISRYLVGGLFIFSGLIKINDPVGTQIKLEEYFTVFAVDIAPFFDALKPLSLFLSVTLSTLEVVLGIALLLKYKDKWVISILLAMIVFFTFLTFYSAYFNKVTDCGCFGDAIKLTPWQSFTKDVILLILILFLFRGRKRHNEDYKKWSPIVVGTIMVLSLIVCFNAIRHLPVIDFRAYKKGTDLNLATMPPSDDPTAVPAITNYAIWGDENDFTMESLRGNKLLVIIHDVEETNMDAYPPLTSLIGALGNDLSSTAITASSGIDFENLRHDVQLAVPYFYSDKTLLKTMIRSNPGLVLMKDGVVMEKWHYNDIPAADEVLNALR
jgi:uncharacterized membrane protein YphA (DoxX/SURF4 family)